MRCTSPRLFRGPPRRHKTSSENEATGRSWGRGGMEIAAGGFQSDWWGGGAIYESNLRLIEQRFE